MKRISMVAISILVIQSGVCRAYYDNCSNRYRTRWSFYKQGLVSGHVRYSLYAWSKAGGSGLVPGNVRYSPYAWESGTAGLVYDPWCGSISPHYSPRYNVVRGSYEGFYDSSQIGSDCNKSCSSEPTQMSYDQKLQARSMRIKRMKQSRNSGHSKRQEDNDLIVSEFLKSRNIKFRTDCFLRIDGRTVSVNFLLEDSDVVVKYWDPEQIVLLLDKPEYKQIIFENYLQKWVDFCEQYLGSGGKICQVVSADEREIISQLINSSELNDG